MNWVISLGRSSFAIALGILIGAGAAMVGIEMATRDRAPIAASEPAAAEPAPRALDGATIVDLSLSTANQAGGMPALLAAIGPGRSEPVVDVNGRGRAASDSAASTYEELRMAWERAQPGDYLDITLGGPIERRVLVLIHP